MVFYCIRFLCYKKAFMGKNKKAVNIVTRREKAKVEEFTVIELLTCVWFFLTASSMLVLTWIKAL